MPVLDVGDPALVEVAAECQFFLGQSQLLAALGDGAAECLLWRERGRHAREPVGAARLPQ